MAGEGQSRPGSRAAASPDPDLGARPPLDDLLAGIPVQAEASRPLAPAPVKKRKAPVERQVRESRYDDDYLNESSAGTSTTDSVLGMLGLLWAIGMLALIGWVFSKSGLRGAILVLPLAVVVPHTVVYFTAIIRIARNGNPGTALLCFLGGGCFGLGELVALVLSYQNTRKWRLEGILPAWTALVVSLFVVSFGVWTYVFWSAAQNAQARNQQRSQERQVAVEQAPSGPPTPQVAAPNLEPFFAILDRKISNRQALVKLLEGIQDFESSKAAAARYKQLESENESLVNNGPPANASADQHRRYASYQQRDADVLARIAKEEFRVRAIPGAADPLGLSPRIPDPSESSQIRPERPRQRPEPTTPEEQINYAIEDLERGDVFKRREAAKTLRSIEVDEFRRDEVSKALQQVITDKDPFLKEEAVAALVKWATRKNMASLMDMLDGAKHSHGDTRKHAIRALAQFKEDKCARAIAKMLFTDDWMVAVDALKEMGPVSEAAVLGQIDNDDPKMRFQVCGILEVVGSSFSLDDLKRHASGDRVREVKQAAKDAVKAIEARSDKSTKSGKSR